MINLRPIYPLRPSQPCRTRRIPKTVQKRKMVHFPHSLKKDDLATVRPLNTSKIAQYQPGLIVIKKGLSHATQIKLAEIAFERGSDPHKGFWKIDAQGQKILNQAPQSPHRGRIFEALKNFPAFFLHLAQESLLAGAQIDKTIKVIDPTHLLLLYYKTLSIPPKTGYIPWHKDIDPNDGEKNSTVVSFTIGDSCELLVCNEKPSLSTNHFLSNPQNLAHRILFESGDILLFGGPSRFIHHGIYKIVNGSAPSFLPFKEGRLNFTFRYPPQIMGQEDKFATGNFKSVYQTGDFE